MNESKTIGNISRNTQCSVMGFFNSALCLIARKMHKKLWPSMARNALKIKQKAIILKNDKKCSIKINKGGIIKQEGPKGPGSLTWGKGQRSQWSHLQSTTNIIHQILVEDLQMMLYIKYESSGHCSFKQGDFWKLHFENLIFDPVTYLCNQSEPLEQLL